jgi:type IV secretion system protein VirB9
MNAPTVRQPAVVVMAMVLLIAIATAATAAPESSSSSRSVPTATYVPGIRQTAVKVARDLPRDVPREGPRESSRETVLEPRRPVARQDALDAPLQPTRDPRIRTVVYFPDAVVTVPVKRGVVTQIVLADDETITMQPAMGKGADCARDTDTWCVIASGRDIFIKPKTGATSNNMVLSASRRRYVFEFKVVAPGSLTTALMRVSVVPPPPPAPPPPPPVVAQAPVDLGPAPLTAKELVANRMRNYAVAVGEFSDDIVPTMVFDDGTKTYFSFPNNRPLPTIFETVADQSEEMVNAHMDGDQLVVDRVSRRFVLRLGNSVASIINEAFDIDGVAPVEGTTIPGVRRSVRAPDATTSVARQEPR